MNEKEKAEAYVRSKCPELMELTSGCRFYDPTAIDWARDLEIITYTPKGKLYFREPDGSVFYATSSYLKGLEIIGHTTKLNDWLRVLNGNNRNVTGDAYSQSILEVTVETAEEYRKILNFNLITGQPDGEENYKAFNQIVGI